jgi:hypothetical protein
MCFSLFGGPTLEMVVESLASKTLTGHWQRGGPTLKMVVEALEAKTLKGRLSKGRSNPTDGSRDPGAPDRKGLLPSGGPALERVLEALTAQTLTDCCQGCGMQNPKIRGGMQKPSNPKGVAVLRMNWLRM